MIRIRRVYSSTLLSDRLRFYEQYGIRPIVGTAYDNPASNLRAGYLIFDSLGRPDPLGRAEARAAVRLIIKRKHGQSVSPDYIEEVVRSAVNVVLTAMDEILAGRRVAYALCRQPGPNKKKGGINPPLLG